MELTRENIKKLNIDIDLTRRNAKMRKFVLVILLLLISTSCIGQEEADTPGTLSVEEGVQQTVGTMEATNTATPEELLEVTFNCPECVDDDGILPISLWETPDEMGSAGYVLHGEICFLLDEAVNSEGIEKVLLRCPNGFGWTRKEAISQ